MCWQQGPRAPVTNDLTNNYIKKGSDYVFLNDSVVCFQDMYIFVVYLGGKGCFYELTHEAKFTTQIHVIC